MIARTLFVLAAGSAGLFGQTTNAPVLSSITPSSVAAGTPDLTMQLTGGPFCTGSIAVLYDFNNSDSPNSSSPNAPRTAGSLSTTYISQTQLRAQIPSVYLSQPFQYAVYVDNELCGTPPTNLVSFTVTSPLAIFPDSLPAGNVGSMYSVPLSTNGGNPSFTWSASGLPSTLSINSLGVLNGTPTLVGEFSVTVNVIDRYGAVASKSYFLSIEPPILDISNPNLPNGVVGVAYDQFFKGVGGTPPYQFFFQQGSLPPGLQLKSDGSGELFGTPTAAGTYKFVVAIRDSLLQSTPHNITLTIDPPRPVITTDTIPNGNVGVAYTQTIAATGGTPPYHWSIVTITTTGFSINASTGVFSGTPATAGGFSATIQVVDSTGASAQKVYTFTISAAPTITTTSLPDGTVGVAYAATVVASGPGPFTWGIAGGNLPDGLILDANSGKISGTPTKAGGFDVTVRAVIPSGLSASKAFHINIAEPVSISTTSLPDGTVGKAYSGMIAATGGVSPFVYSVVARTLPDGLALDSKTGAITGTPTTAGTLSVGFGVTDAASGTASKDLSIRILAPLSISPDTLPAATVGTAYTQTVSAAGGLTPYVFSGSVPDGFTLNPSSGVITGTPTAAGSLAFAVTVTDALKATATKSYTVQANLPALPTPAIGGLPATSPPARQPNVTLTLGTPFPADITGTLTLTFTSAVGGSDDTVQFTTGGRTVNFTIPKNTTTATFPTATVGVITGTVAGTIRVTASLKTGSTDLTPSPAPTQSITVAQAPPVLTKVVLNTTSTGYEVLVTGYSTTRSMIRGSFTFAATSTANLQTTQVTVPVDAAFLTWFNGTTSNATGGMFTLTVPFSVSGPSNAVSSVTVILTNASGDSNALSPQ